MLAGKPAKVEEMKRRAHYFRTGTYQVNSATLPNWNAIKRFGDARFPAELRQAMVSIQRAKNFPNQHDKKTTSKGGSGL